MTDWVVTRLAAALGARVDGVVMNDEEARSLTGERNLIKAGNAILLKGGREAAHSNRAIVDAIHSGNGVPTSPSVSLESHHLAFAAEHARVTGEVIDMAAWRSGAGR